MIAVEVTSDTELCPVQIFYWNYQLRIAVKFTDPAQTNSLGSNAGMSIKILHLQPIPLFIGPTGQTSAFIIAT
jgi:hypothetical protein